MIAVLSLVALLSSSPIEAYVYPTSAVVSEVNYDYGYIHLVDGAGREWQWNETEDWMEGDLASMIMSDMGTPDWVYDDEIIAIQYSGFSY